MKTERVCCDHCEFDLTSTGNSVDYRLALIVEGKASRGNVVTLLHIEPPLSRPHHFCGLKCLAEWLKAQQG